MANPRFIYVIGFTMLVLSSGCGANFNSIHRELDISKGKGVLIDIKQRAIFSRLMTAGTKTFPVFCAEPSPDALSAYAAALSGNVDIASKGSLGFSGQTQESASFVGLRTQSIQLLRDFLYRDCEAYMNEAIDKYQYDTLMRRSQKYMVALLGIEQLTGAVAAMPSTLNINAGTGSVTSTVTSTVVSTVTGTGTVTSKITSTVMSTGTASVISSGTGTATQQDKAPTSKMNNVDSVANAVNTIVSQILQTDDIGQSCFAYLAAGPTPPNEELGDICTTYLETATVRKANANNASPACLELIIKLAASGSKPDELVPLIKALNDLQICNFPIDVMRLK